MSRRIPGGWLAGVIVLLLLVLLPLAIGSGQLNLPTEVLIWALFALTYDLIFGYTGLISFGHALFVGSGAYALTIAVVGYHLAFPIALLVVLVAGIVLSLVSGLLALRTRGVSFAMVTLAFAQAAFTLAQSDVGNLTGGENGLLLSGAPDWLTGAGSAAHIYYVALASLVAGFLLQRLFVLSPAGRVWQAVRENEARALAIGYRPYTFKLLAYTVSGTIATLAGALYALSVGDVSPNLLASDTTIQLLLMVIIGGAGSLWGAMLGAALIRYLDHYLNTFSTSSLIQHLPGWLQNTLGQPLLLFGIIYLLLVYFFPQGIAGLLQHRFHLGRSLVPQPGLAEVEARAEGETPGEPTTNPMHTSGGG